DPPRDLLILGGRLSAFTDFDGGGAMLNADAEYRFSFPITIRASLAPLALASKDGTSFGSYAFEAAVGLDLPLAAIDAVGGVTSLSDETEFGQRVAPTAGFRIRLGLVDSVALWLAANVVIPDNDPIHIHRLAGGIQARLSLRFFFFSGGDVQLRSGIFGMAIGTRYWLRGVGDSGSVGIDLRLGVQSLATTPQCEFGPCGAVDPDQPIELFLMGPSLSVGVEARL
ncbi:MAG: hypothetical protein AAGF12_28225, partial [Myxococcota bacterium]